MRNDNMKYGQYTARPANLDGRSLTRLQDRTFWSKKVNSSSVSQFTTQFFNSPGFPDSNMEVANQFSNTAHFQANQLIITHSVAALGLINEASMNLVDKINQETYIRLLLDGQKVLEEHFIYLFKRGRFLTTTGTSEIDNVASAMKVINEPVLFKPGQSFLCEVVSNPGSDASSLDLTIAFAGYLLYSESVR